MDALELERIVNRFFAGAYFVLNHAPQRLLVDLHPERFDLRVWGDLTTHQKIRGLPYKLLPQEQALLAELTKWVYAACQKQILQPATAQECAAILGYFEPATDLPAAFQLPYISIE